MFVLYEVSIPVDILKERSFTKRTIRIDEELHGKSK